MHCGCRLGNKSLRTQFGIVSEDWLGIAKNRLKGLPCLSPSRLSQIHKGIQSLLKINNKIAGKVCHAYLLKHFASFQMGPLEEMLDDGKIQYLITNRNSDPMCRLENQRNFEFFGLELKLTFSLLENTPYGRF